MKQNVIGHGWEDTKVHLHDNLHALNRKYSVAGIRKALYTTDPWKNIAYALAKKQKSKSK